jgi:hypothetical protein
MSVVEVVPITTEEPRAWSTIKIRLLGLDGLAVVAVEKDGESGPLVHLVTSDERAHNCPGCDTPAVRVKQWTVIRPRDLPVAGRVCRLWWRKRRWYCDLEPCARRTFTESVAQVRGRKGNRELELRKPTEPFGRLDARPSPRPDGR